MKKFSKGSNAPIFSVIFDSFSLISIAMSAHLLKGIVIWDNQQKINDFLHNTVLRVQDMLQLKLLKTSITCQLSNYSSSNVPRVFETNSKTCNNLLNPVLHRKLSSLTCYTKINFLWYGIALQITVASCPT